ncbi:MAG TPA: Zn-dependent hydrolase [Hyphomicrobiaceae bacterium]|nr:Zn-dependent hydrolase [Hyphomicrobiaceae bacterium]
MTTCRAERAVEDLRALARIGAYETGVHKPSLSAEHVKSLDWFAGRAKAAGLDVTIDGIGNVMAVTPGAGPRLLTGSHLESQNHAGWLDGPLGVIYGLEAARAILEDQRLKGSGIGVDVGVWCDEEGHFGHFLGSRSAVGEVSEADIDAASDRTHGTPMRRMLADAGFAGRQRFVIDPKRYVGYLEAHIEQGDWLEANHLKIGVVTSIVGIRQYKVTFEGAQNHAGTTRMAIRRDAGLACARLCVAIDETFPKFAGERTVWTTGRITLDPGGPSIIPGRAEMLFQVRDADAAVLDRMEAALGELVTASDRRGPCRAHLERLRASRPAIMDQRIMGAIEAATAAHVPGKSTRIPSGAGHDAQVFAGHMPAGMMFVPSIGGISHHWTENTSDEDIMIGAKVFVDACVGLLTAKV